tara:strand:- start:290 stop:2314 length:2025 start_codon:yes stop_codon:yes gene_type:complete
MSVYNGEKFLRESIDSILNQTYTDFEFLIINDGSTDSTREIILSYDDPRITLINNKLNMGLSKSLNIGIHRARGEYIARQDADDVSNPLRIEIESALIQKRNLDVVYCRYQYLSINGKRLSWVSPVFSARNLGKGLIALNDPIAHGSVLMNKESLIDAGGYNEVLFFSQDYELWLRLLSLNKKFKCADYVGYFQRLLPKTDKTKRDSQRLYTSIVTDHYVNGKKIPTSELTDLYDKLVSPKRFQQRPRRSPVQKFYYWCKILKIQIRGFLNNHAINSNQSVDNKNHNKRILMITGAYYPEISGAANQCRQLIDSLKDKLSFFILTTVRDINLPPSSQVDGVELFRVFIRNGFINYSRAFWLVTLFFFYQRKEFQIVHLHGFSLKSALLTVLSRIFQKKIILKMTSIGHDDPIAMRQRSFLLKTFFSKTHVFVGSNPEFEKLYRESELPTSRYQQIPNGVDTARFHPVPNQEKLNQRNQLGLPEKMKIILFVGHFSKEKCPDLLMNAWMDIISKILPETGIVFIGSTDSGHYEVEDEMVREIKEFSKPFLNERIFFVEKTDEIEKHYQCADSFVLPSLREGTPNALLEAMACGLPVIASNLKGVTDWVIEDGKDGFLFEPGNNSQLGETLLKVFKNDELCKEMGLQARKTIMKRFSMEKVAEAYLSLYEMLIQSA